MKRLDKDKLYMNPEDGSIDNGENWEADFEARENKEESWEDWGGNTLVLVNDETRSVALQELDKADIREFVFELLNDWSKHDLQDLEEEVFFEGESEGIDCMVEAYIYENDLPNTEATEEAIKRLITRACSVFLNITE